MPGREGRPRHCLAALLACASLAGAILGCGGGGETQATVTVTESEPSASSSARSKARSTSERAETTVRHYYRAVDAGRFAEAWSLLAPGLQGELGGFAAWRDGYHTTVSTRAFAVQAIEAGSGSALVGLELESADIDECGSSVDQTFSGTWSLISEGGRFRATSFDIEKTGGGTPVLDPDGCGGEAAPGQPAPYEEESGGCDPNYTGCVPESPYDVDCDEVREEVEVIGEDIYGLDREGDGYACESYG